VAVGRSHDRARAARAGGLLKLVGDSPSLALTSWRILVIDDRRRVVRADHPAAAAPAYCSARRLRGADGMGAVAAVRLGLDPCPLCSLQRIAVIAIGVVFLIAAIHNPGRLGAGSTPASS
jgi:hypothetical protein